MQEEEGEKIMAELKRKKERDALEEEVRVLERQLKTTVRPSLAQSSFLRCPVFFFPQPWQLDVGQERHATHLVIILSTLDFF